MVDLTCEVLVIGAGPGGYTAAIRSAQLGFDTVIVEADNLGGTCLNIGCIPSKALVHAADVFAEMRRSAQGGSPFGVQVEAPGIDFTLTMAWKQRVVDRLAGGVATLLRKAGVRVVPGWASLLDGKTVRVNGRDGEEHCIRTEHLVLATGSRPVELPCLPFGGSVLSSTEALALDHIPEKLAVVGGGYIGLELGTAFAKLGSTVTVVELAERILPAFDEELAHPVMRRLAELDVNVLVGAQALRFKEHSRALVVNECGGTEIDVDADRVLVTVGRAPQVDGWGLEELDLDRSGPFIRIDDRCRTSMRGVYSVGDLTGEPMLAHRAISQGELVAEVIAGRPNRWDKMCIPAVAFTDPELVSVGLSKGAALASGVDVVEGRFPFGANGRALTTADTNGFVQVVARADDHLLIGVHAVGAGASELAAPFALALEMGARLEDVAATIHAHPTRGEAFQEAAMHAIGHALHK